MIIIDQTSFIPPFEQIRSQFAAQISDGALPAGARLPTVRRLAKDLGLAVNTVARAYRELEMSGLVATRGRGGTTVTSAGNISTERLQIAADSYAATALSLGIGEEQALSQIKAALHSRRGAPAVTGTASTQADERR